MEAHHFPKLFQFLFQDVLNFPVGRDLCNVKEKAPQHLIAADGVSDFRMILEGVDFPFLILNGNPDSLSQRSEPNQQASPLEFTTIHISLSCSRRASAAVLQCCLVFPGARMLVGVVQSEKI